MTTTRAVPTPYGEGRLTVHPASRAVGTLVLSHGAGSIASDSSSSGPLFLTLLTAVDTG